MTEDGVAAIEFSHTLAVVEKFRSIFSDLPQSSPQLRLHLFTRSASSHPNDLTLIPPLRLMAFRDGVTYFCRVEVLDQ